MTSKINDKSKPHACIADRVWNYVQMAIVKLQNKGLWESSIEEARDIYQDARSDLILTDINPKSCSSGLVYFIAVKKGEAVTQQDISNCYDGIISSTVRTHYKRFKDWDSGKELKSVTHYSL